MGVISTYSSGVILLVFFKNMKGFLSVIIIVSNLMKQLTHRDVTLGLGRQFIDWNCS